MTQQLLLQHVILRMAILPTMVISIHMATFREYPDLLTGPENWKQIEKYSDNLQRYLEFIRSKHLKMLE